MSRETNGGESERAAVRALEQRDRRASLPNSDFTEPPTPKRQTICMPFGLPGCGKTWTILMYAPSPIAYFDIDRRGWYAAQAARAAGKVIHYVDIPYPAGIARTEDGRAKAVAQASIDRFNRNFEVAMHESQKGSVASIVADTLTELYELAKIATEGRVDRKPKDYGAARGITNAGFKSVLKLARTESLAHFIGIARGKKVFEDPTKVQYEGPEFFDFDMDWSANIRHRRFKSEGEMKRTPPAERFEMEITKAGYDNEQLGAVYTPDDWGPVGPFAYACTLNHPGSSPKDWK
jgi:hypothetical protein